jgi:hypothetical protein
VYFVRWIGAHVPMGWNASRRACLARRRAEREEGVDERGIELASAEIETVGADFGHLEPMLDAAQRELGAAGVNDTPEVLLADAGYWRGEQMQRIVDRGIEVLFPPDTGRRRTTRRNWDGGRYDQMRRVLATDRGSELYRKRQPMIEPVFAQMKFKPRPRPLPTTRTRRRPRGMAANHRHPQPPQAPPPRSRGRLTAVAGRHSARRSKSHPLLADVERRRTFATAKPASDSPIHRAAQCRFARGASVSRPSGHTPARDELRACRLTFNSRSLVSANADVRTSSSVRTADRSGAGVSAPGSQTPPSP